MQGAENTARRGQHRGKVVLVDDRGEIPAVAGVFHHAGAAQIPQHGTDGLRRAFLVYMRRFAGIDAECV